MNAPVRKLPAGTPKPTAQAQPYVDALGLQGALRFLMHYGGTEVYIRRKNFNTASYVNVTGEAGARALAEIIDRLPRRVPSQKPWIADVLSHQGLPTNEIARALRLSDVAVRKMLKTRRDRAAQGFR